MATSWCCLSVGALGVLVSALAQAQPPKLELLWRDDFSGGRRYELLGPRSWEFRDQACHVKGSSRDVFACATMGELELARVEVAFTVQRRVTPSSYDCAGLSLMRDPDNDWKLIFVEGPDGKRYFELIERFQGLHQAQTTQGPTRLAGTTEGALTTWEYDRDYQLTLSLNKEGIVGEVNEGTRGTKGNYWRRSYSFASGKAVRRGQPALFSRGMDAVFRQFIVHGVRPAAMPNLSVVRGASGSVAILAQDSAAELRGLFEKAGFGVSVLRWDDLGVGRIPAETLDLLVLADARRLPVTAVDATTAYLRSGGKLIALGAPAFGELLLKTPSGWVTKDRYSEAVFATLKPQPIAFDLKTWRRNARDPKRQAAIVEDPAEGKGCLKLSCDLEGWDGFTNAVEKPFPDGHTLTTFWAKGDANTPQLSLEWRENDGSRWIATVEMTTEWKPYVLRPSDFLYWYDSPTKNRGGAGDRLNPQNAANLTLCLSSSHTPKARPGPHTYWIRDLATAADTGMGEADFHVPDIEGLCPSYKLHPLWESASLRAGGDQRVLPASWTLATTIKGYSPNWRPSGQGIDRGRSWRWLPVVESYDASGRHRGALVSLMLGDGVLPNALWANVGVAEPADALKPQLSDALIALAKAMSRGCFLLEGGTQYFSYADGEPIWWGAVALNAGREERRLTVRTTMTHPRQRMGVRDDQTVAPGTRSTLNRQQRMGLGLYDREGYEVRTELFEGDVPLDSISHRIEFLPTYRARKEDFARVQGSNFYVGEQKWFMLGINYWPNAQGGLPTVAYLLRENYDPAIVERDMAWMESIGINFLTGVQAPNPPDPEAPGAFRDLHDFLNRCHRHGMKVFYFLHGANPLPKADIEKVKAHITAAGIKDHPAIFSWELAWEPIHSPGSNKRPMEFLKPDWNAWVVERYGSVANAEADWGYKPERDKDGQLVMPVSTVFDKHGEWDRMAAAFRRFFSDRVSRAYREV
ncbi:MAG: hypothetical protein FJ279_22475, partial [Planctomycetes bacterium]|nr:hypothetical protein [Planctomycetota bacterium]